MKSVGRSHPTRLAAGVAFLLLLQAGSAEAGIASKTDRWFFGREPWDLTAQLNVGFLGTLTGGVNRPPGGLFVQPHFGIWWNKFLEAYTTLQFSAGAASSFLAVGGGLRMNVLEFSKANALDFAGENTAGMRCIETKRGLFSLLLRSFMVHVSFGVNQYFLADPAPGLTYPTSDLALQWGGGVQWGPNVRIDGISRFYIDTSVYFTAIAGGKYVVPVAGLGLNF